MHNSKTCRYLFLFIQMLWLCGSSFAQKLPTHSTNSQDIYRKDTVICSSTFKIKAVLPPKSFGYWKVVGRKVKISPDSTNYNVEISNLDRDTNVVVWTVYTQFGDTVKEVTKVINHTPSNPVILSRAAPGKDGTCSYKDTLRGRKIIGERLEWSVSQPTAASVANDTARNTSVRNLPHGATIVRLQTFKGKCSNSESGLAVDTIFNILPLKGNAGNDTAVCGSEVLLNAQKPLIGIGQWSALQEVFFDNVKSEKAKAINLKEGKNTFVWTSSNGGCSATAPDTVFIFNVSPSQPHIIPITPSAICQDTIQVAADKPNQGIGRWVGSVGSSIVIEENGLQAKIKNLSEGNNTIYWSVETPGFSCPAKKDMIVITNLRPSKANILTPDTTVCIDSVILRPKAPFQGTGSWYSVIKRRDQIVSETQINNSTGYFVSTEDTSYYKWKVAFGGCEASEAIVQVINGRPKQVSAGLDTVICNTLTSLNAAKLRTNHQGSWTLLDNNTTARIETPTRTNSRVSNLKIGNNFFIWQVLNSESRCPAISDTVKITNNLPKPIDAGADKEFCGTSIDLKPTQADNNFAGVFGKWRLIRKPSKAGNILFDETSIFTKADSLTKAGVYTFRLTVSNESFCSISDTVNFTRIQFDTIYATAKPNTCNSFEFLSGYNPIDKYPAAKVVWQIVMDPQKLERAYIENASAPIATLHEMNLTDTNYIVEYSISNKGCDALNTRLQIRRNKFVDAKIENKEIELCGDTARLVAIKPLEGIGEWSVLNSNLKAKLIKNPESPHIAKAYNLNIFNSDNSSGTTRFRWTVTNGQCDAGIEDIIVKRYLAPEKFSLPVTHLETCEDKPFTIRALPPKLYTGKGAWYVKNQIISTDTILKSVILGNLPYGKSNLIWRVTNQELICPSQEDTLVLTKYPVVAKPSLDIINTVLCVDSSKIKVSKNFHENSFWRNLQTDSIVQAALVGPGMYSLKNLKQGINQYEYQVYDGLCKNSDTVIFTVNKGPSRPIIFNEEYKSLCLVENRIEYRVMAASPKDGSTGRWLSDNPNLRFFPLNQDTIATVTLPVGLHNIIWETQSVDGVCKLADTITVNVRSVPVNVSAGNSIQTHKTEGAFQADPLQLNVTGRWHKIQGTATISDTLDPKSTFSNLSLGQNIFVWSVANTCATKSDTVVIEHILFKVPKGFSPNGDGNNDRFEIKGVEQFYPRELIIFNRWGSEVFKNTIYNNEWDGKSFNGDHLADDTYYYTLKLENNKVLTGFVVLKR